MTLGSLLQQLSARLPELEWKTSQLGDFIPNRFLPRGLFHYSLNYSAKACIAEIKTDIEIFSQQETAKSAQFMAEKIHRKIAVLVYFCNEEVKKKALGKKKPVYTLEVIHSRQQWLENLEQEILVLTQQKEALIQSLVQAQFQNKTETMLAIKSELGELEKQLTLSQEKFKREIKGY